MAGRTSLAGAPGAGPLTAPVLSDVLSRFSLVWAVATAVIMVVIAVGREWAGWSIGHVAAFVIALAAPPVAAVVLVALGAGLGTTLARVDDLKRERRLAAVRRGAGAVEPLDGVELRVRTIVASVLDRTPASIPMVAELVDDLGCDSLDACEIALLLEDQTGIVVADGDVADVVTVRDLARVLADRGLGARV